MPLLLIINVHFVCGLSKAAMSKCRKVEEAQEGRMRMVRVARNFIEKLLLACQDVHSHTHGVECGSVI